MIGSAEETSFEKEFGSQEGGREKKRKVAVNLF